MFKHLSLGLIFVTGLLAVALPSPVASAYECGPITTWWSTSLQCDLYCNAYHYIYVHAWDDNTAHYVRGSVNCADQSAACGATASCDVWTSGTTTYSQNGAGNCNGSRDYIASTFHLYCKSSGVKSSSTTLALPIDGDVSVSVTVVGMVAVATQCVTQNGAETCQPAMVACRLTEGIQTCSASLTPWSS